MSNIPLDVPNDDGRCSSLRTSYVKAPKHLNSTGCCIKYIQGKGKGVFATRNIPSQTIIEISPVLLFEKQEYEEHGKHTVLDHYTFIWRDGRMALALGLGSLFNHSKSPNVSYTLDHETESIRYTTAKPVQSGEELCIFYGHNLWFEPVDAPRMGASIQEEQDDGLGGLSAVYDEVDQADAQDESASNGERRLNVDRDAYMEGNPEDIVPEGALPFTRLKLTPDEEEEEDMDSIRAIQAWVVDIPDPRHTTTMLKYIKQSGLDDPTLAHLKRVRKLPTQTTILLSRGHICPVLSLPDPDLTLPPPYQLKVPLTAALTMSSLKLKSNLWPTVYAPRRKGEMEEWSKGKVRWASEAMRLVAGEARKCAKEKGELPIVAYVPSPYSNEGDNQLSTSFVAHDTRKSTAHPLRHAIINLVRSVGDFRATHSTSVSPTPTGSPPVDTQNPIISRSGDASPSPSVKNGAHYLLTALTLFVTHEPCLMCSMALLHSRVKEVYYLIPMEKTGGCGGSACLPKLEGVNHRFGIARWKVEYGGVSQEGLELEDSVDV